MHILPDIFVVGVILSGRYANSFYHIQQIIKPFNMKSKYKSIVSALCFMCMAACGQGDPKAEVTAFANRFASYVAQNQLDSIRAVYPDAAECDSFALNFVADSMRVRPTNRQARSL